MKRIKNFINNIRKLVNNQYKELLIMASFIIITVNTITINVHAGFYVMAALLLLIVFSSR